MMNEPINAAILFGVLCLVASTLSVGMCVVLCKAERENPDSGVVTVCMAVTVVMQMAAVLSGGVCASAIHQILYPCLPC